MLHIRPVSVSCRTLLFYKVYTNVSFRKTTIAYYNYDSKPYQTPLLFNLEIYPVRYSNLSSFITIHPTFYLYLIFTAFFVVTLLGILSYAGKVTLILLQFHNQDFWEHPTSLGNFILCHRFLQYPTIILHNGKVPFFT